MVAVASTGIVVVLLICWTVGKSDQHLYLTSIPSYIQRSFVIAYKRGCRAFTLWLQSSSYCPVCYPFAEVSRIFKKQLRGVSARMYEE